MNNLNLFNQKNDNSLNILDFLFDTLLIEDPYHDTDEESIDTLEENIEYNINE